MFSKNNNEESGMIKLTFIEKSGVTKVVKGSIGDNLMELAKVNDIAGIDGDCGGCCSCGTCCMLFEKHDALGIEAPSDAELGILEFVSDELIAGQRLGCQITLSQELDSATIHVAT